MKRHYQKANIRTKGERPWQMPTGGKYYEHTSSFNTLTKLLNKKKKKIPVKCACIHLKKKNYSCIGRKYDMLT